MKVGTKLGEIISGKGKKYVLSLHARKYRVNERVAEVE